MNLTTPPIDKFVSVVITLDSPLPLLDMFLQETASYLEKSYVDFEILVVDAKSGIVNEQAMQQALTSTSSIRHLRLTAKVRHDIAVIAGLENAIGDYIVVMSPTTDAIEMIGRAVPLCDGDIQGVIGVAKQSRSLAYKIVRPWTQGLLRAIDYTLPANASGFLCLRRSAVNEITATGLARHQLSIRISRLDYAMAVLPYTLQAQPESRTLWQGFCQGIEFLVFNSTRPLRWMSFLGLTGSFFAFCFAIYSLCIRLLRNQVVEGWTSTILFIALANMVLFIMLAFIGEYLGRLLDDRNETQTYMVAYEKSSSCMLNELRYNVVVSAKAE